MSTDLMIQMGLLNVLINRLETSIKDLKEEHEIDRYRVSRNRVRDDDSDSETIFPKRVKIEFTPPRFLPVRNNFN